MYMCIYIYVYIYTCMYIDVDTYIYSPTPQILRMPACVSWPYMREVDNIRGSTTYADMISSLLPKTRAHVYTGHESAVP